MFTSNKLFTINHYVLSHFKQAPRGPNDRLIQETQVTLLRQGYRWQLLQVNGKFGKYWGMPQDFPPERPRRAPNKVKKEPAPPTAAEIELLNDVATIENGTIVEETVADLPYFTMRDVLDSIGLGTHIQASNSRIMRALQAKLSQLGYRPTLARIDGKVGRYWRKPTG